MMDLKKEYGRFIETDFSRFSKACESQWKCGGKRYALEEDKEYTDLVCEVAGNVWIGGNIIKYAGEIVNTLKYDGAAQEVNFFKIAVYSFIWWLKEFKHPTTGIRLKEKHWPEFVTIVGNDVRFIFEVKPEIVQESPFDYRAFISKVKEFNVIEKNDFFIIRIAAMAYLWWLQNRDNFTQRDTGEEFSYKGEIEK